jgi:signal transduction histidine kinase
LQGMRERVALVGGTLSFEPANPGTLVRARMPAQRPTNLDSRPASL